MSGTGIRYAGIGPVYRIRYTGTDTGPVVGEKKLHKVSKGYQILKVENFIQVKKKNISVIYHSNKLIEIRSNPLLISAIQEFFIFYFRFRGYHFL